MKISSYLRVPAAVLLGAILMLASEHHGLVTLGGLPVPGAIVTATQGEKKVTAVTDGMGSYSFPDLADGTWSVQVEMSGFSTLKQDVTVGPAAPGQTAGTSWELKIKTLAEMQAAVQAPLLEARPAPPSATANTARPSASNAKGKPAVTAQAQAGAPAPGAAAAAPADPAPDDPSQRAADGFLVNGSQVNGGASPFALNPAFGNNRRGPRSLYNYNLGFQDANSVLNARPYSQSGSPTPKAPYNNMTFTGSVGGPLRIPHVIRNLANFTINYQLTRNRNASTPSDLVPTQAERNGDLSSFNGQIINPATLLPFPNNQIPANLISPAAQALLNLYPLPNTTNGRFNYQASLISRQQIDQMQTRFNRQLGRKNSINGVFAFQDIRSQTPSIFEYQNNQFLDKSTQFGINIDPVWRHQFTPRMSATLEFQFTRSSTNTMSYFENRANISGQAGITGNYQNPLYWGPPALNFTGGITSLSDTNPSIYKPQTGLLKSDSNWNHGRHNFTFGADLRKQQFNYLSQSNPRGSFTFNGSATALGPTTPGSDFADFLLGIPDSSALAFGNADKYLRSTGYDGYVNDDWRVNSALTVNIGLRYEYNGPLSELYGRLVNLDVAPGFTNVAPVVANSPTGSLSRQSYPSSLVRPERYPFEPGIGIAWRPISGSSLVVRAGYNLRYGTSLYNGIATNMDQQAPLSRSLLVANTAANPLTLANGFVGSPQFTADQFGIDPNFRESYAQNWLLTLQKDLPGGMQLQVGYTGIKGTRMPQFFYPNTYALNGVDPCPECPSGFRYETSNGNLTRNAGTLQLRRRLHNGFTASLNYTYAKSIDDSGTAQNWLDLSAERGLSGTDQRHLVAVNLQYTSGTGIGGGNFISGWKAAVLKEWTFVLPIQWGTGFPITPTLQNILPGTGSAGGILRPNFTGAPVYAASGGLSLNPAAFAVPAPGEFGNAAVGSLTGPSQFSLNASMQRTFRVSDRVSMDLRVDSTNTLNHVVPSSYIATVENLQFGLPVINPNQMRKLATTFRFRF